jgi:hypothetical protein
MPQRLLRRYLRQRTNSRHHPNTGFDQVRSATKPSLSDRLYATPAIRFYVIDFRTEKMTDS